MRVDVSKFAGREDLFRYLHENKSEILDLKKSALKFTDGLTLNMEADLPIVKALTTNFEDNPLSGEIKRTIIGNTYNYMDSHNDVHLSGIFSKSIQERKDKIFHLENHNYTISAKVGKPVDVYEKQIAWRDLGFDKFGNTEALFMDTLISKARNPQVFEAYLLGEVDQHSVGMQYVNIDLAMNDDEYKEAFALWNSTIELLGNRDKAEEQGFFWIVREAKLKEISCVLEGSNDLTPTLENKNLKPLANTSKDEPSEDDTPNDHANFIYL